MFQSIDLHQDQPWPQTWNVGAVFRLESPPTINAACAVSFANGSILQIDFNLIFNLIVKFIAVAC